MTDPTEIKLANNVAAAIDKLCSVAHQPDEYRARGRVKLMDALLAWGKYITREREKTPVAKIRTGVSTADLASKLTSDHWAAVLHAALEGVGYICNDFEDGELSQGACSDLYDYALRKIQGRTVCRVEEEG